MSEKDTDGNGHPIYSLMLTKCWDEQTQIGNKTLFENSLKYILGRAGDIV